MNKIFLLLIINCLPITSLTLYGMEHVPTIIPSAINKLDTEGNSPLYYAVANDNYKMAKYLLNQGAEPNIDGSDFPKKTPLILAVNNQSVKLVSLLLYCKADINKADRDGNTPLHHAIKTAIKYNNSMIDCILKMLLNHEKIEKNLSNKDEEATPLHLAVKANRFDLVQQLLPLKPSDDNSLDNNIPNIDENHFYE